MGSRRTLVLIVAVVVGLMSGLFLYNYVRNTDDRAAEKFQLVEVFRVTTPIPKSTTGQQAIDQGWLQKAEIPATFKPTSSIGLDAVKGKVAVIDLAVGTVLQEGLFVDPRVASVSTSERVPEGQVAVSFQVGSEQSVANLIVPGDRINIMVQIPDPTDESPPTQMMFQNVDVLAVGAALAPQPGERAPAAGGGLITVAVPLEASMRIAHASTDTEIYLSLSSKDLTPVRLTPIDAGNLIPTALTPYG